MSGIYSDGTKNNKYVKKAIITGVMKYAKAIIFSGMNNFSEFNVLEDEKFLEFVGFTEKEVDLLINKVTSESDKLKIRRIKANKR